jgi:tetratricopeptide (TPR) repeat protein
VADSPRIAELRRRVELDPASILFAQLAEEYRRAGQLADAVRVCRAGLARYPDYLAARVTLGRALMDLGQDADAQRELESVLRAAPDNLAALRSLSELQQRHPWLDEFPVESAGPAGDAAEPIPDAAVQESPRSSQREAPIETRPIDIPPIDIPPMDIPPIDTPPIDTPPIDTAPLDTAPIDALPTDALPIDDHADAGSLEDPVIQELEHWLEAIVADRAARRRMPPVHP